MKLHNKSVKESKKGSLARMDQIIIDKINNENRIDKLEKYKFNINIKLTTLENPNYIQNIIKVFKTRKLQPYEERVLEILIEKNEKNEPLIYKIKDINERSVNIYNFLTLEDFKNRKDIEISM